MGLLALVHSTANCSARVWVRALLSWLVAVSVSGCLLCAVVGLCVCVLVGR